MIAHNCSDIIVSLKLRASLTATLIAFIGPPLWHAHLPPTPVLPLIIVAVIVIAAIAITTAAIVIITVAIAIIIAAIITTILNVVAVGASRVATHLVILIIALIVSTVTKIKSCLKDWILGLHSCSHRCLQCY